MTANRKDYGGTSAENYQRFFVPSIGGPVAEGLIEVARLQPPERVLDVACGTGVVTRLAAKHVGAAGRVTGLDVNPDMLTVARSETPSNVAIDWYEASAESLPFADAEFDVVLCQMGILTSTRSPNSCAAPVFGRSKFKQGPRSFICQRLETSSGSTFTAPRWLRLWPTPIAPSSMRWNGMSAPSGRSLPRTDRCLVR